MEQNTVNEEGGEIVLTDDELSSTEDTSSTHNMENIDTFDGNDLVPTTISAEEHNQDNLEQSENPAESQPIRYHTKKILKYQTPASSLEPLPEGWVTVPHCTGIPVYLHRPTRVVTWSRPYVVSTGGIRKHNPPVTSIPCLEYKRIRQRIEKEVVKGDINLDEPADSSSHVNSTAPNDLSQNETESQQCNGVTDDTSRDANNQLNVGDNGAESELPKVILHNNGNEQLDSPELVEYLSQRFQFNTVKIPHFHKWSEKRQFTRKLKREANGSVQEKDLPEPRKLGPAKVITLTIPRESGSERPQKVVFNTSVKPMVCVLHEYAQSVLRTKPQYLFTTKDDSNEPFEAKIMINDKAYGSATGINKKAAKNKAALVTMEMLVPGFKDQVENLSGETSVEYFNDVSITDNRIYELCVHAGNYLPYHLLTECLKRNQGITDTNVKFDVQIGKSKNIEYKMECGKHVVTGSAKNKKIGKQHAAQQILKLLHPKVTSWGKLIRMYGTSVAEKRARKKNIEQEIFELKQRRASNSNKFVVDENGGSTIQDEGASSTGLSGKNRETLGPNPELLSKLRNMMVELGEERRAFPKKRTSCEAENVREDSSPEKKKSKLLLIDV